MSAYVIGIDLGTSGCRSAIFNEKLEMISCCAQTYPLVVISDIQIEQDANIWWDAVKKTMKDAVLQSCVPASEIKSISISSQGIGFVPVDKNGETLCNSISWLDSRAVAETKQITEKMGVRTIYETTGKIIIPQYTLPKLVWFKNNEKEIYDSAWKFLLPMDYILFKLSGQAVTDQTMAAGTLLYDIKKNCWMENVISDNGIDHQKLSEVVLSGRSVGNLLPSVAKELGLCADTKVTCGGQDQKCAALGAGIEMGVATVSLGTGSCITKIFDHPVFDPEMRITASTFVDENVWELEGVVNTAASAYQWFRDAFAPEKTFTELDDLAEAAGGPNKEKFYPFLQGDGSPYLSSGTGTFTGLAMISDLGRLARAVLEGVGFRIRENIDAMCFDGDYEEIRIFGGGSKSELWCSIIADIMQKRVTRLPKTEAALLGAAKLALRGIGVISTENILPTESFEPEVENSKRYQEAYQDYETIRKKYFGK